MVDLAEIQAAYYMVAATGVLVAAFYYLMVLREQVKNRRINQTHIVMQTLQTYEGMRRWIDLMNMEWKDYDDFEKRYGSDVNPDNFANRSTMFRFYNAMGYLVESGLADVETVHKLNGIGPIWVWAKFEPIIKENRRRYSGKNEYWGMEYLAGEVLKVKLRDNPSYKVPERFTRYLADK